LDVVAARAAAVPAARRASAEPRAMLTQGFDLAAEIIGFILFFSLVAIVSASEQVFLVLTETQVYKIKEDGHGRRERVLEYVRQPQRVVVASILASGVFSASAILCVLLMVASDRGLGLPDLIGAGVLGGLALAILGRALPRAIVTSHPERYAMALVPAFQVVDVLFRPLTVLVRRLLERVSPDSSEEIVAAEEAKAVTEEHDAPPRLEEEKRELIQTIFEFGGTTAKEVMVPRIDMIMADVVSTRDDLLRLVAEHGHSRIPIYEGSVDKVIGAIHVKQLVGNGNGAHGVSSIRELVRPVVFVPESKKIDEIVGEIEDEDDTAEKLVEPIEEGVWRVAGKMDLDDLNEELNLQLPTENSDTLGGFIFEIAGKVPSPGEVVESHGLRFVIDRVHRQRVVRVRIEKLEEARAREGKGGGGIW
jgi:putative hemolysin